MAGVKESFEIDLNPDQMAFVRLAREKYGIADEGKVVRIIMDYIITTPAIHDTLFNEVRCLRCE
jgi:uncharacterized linocin/CFP29 family protein